VTGQLVRGDTGVDVRFAGTLSSSRASWCSPPTVLRAVPVERADSYRSGRGDRQDEAPP
jgi:hypothetical protein